MLVHQTSVRVIGAWDVPWGWGPHPAEVHYIGPWPDGGSGMCSRRFDAPTVAESNRLAHTFAFGLRVAGNGTVKDRGEFWEIEAA